MVGISKDARKLNLAQSLYDDGVDSWLAIVAELNIEILEINDILRGYAAGESDKKYQISSKQHSALQDRFTFWANFMKAPDKAVAHINNGLKKEHKKQSKKTETIQHTPQLAVFSPKAKK
ncbi:MAG: hypothetical protein GY804_00280 [Alphaproteobacteria bacterium]|nr:hypothetical protein [Alphaproteobacteria bacterium]